MPSPDFSILIPVYNEEKCLVPNLLKLLVFLRDRGLNAEIILGSNGSTDSTVYLGRLLQEADPERIRFFHLKKRGAVGDVFRQTIRMARSPLLISLDMDLSVDLDFIPRAVGLLDRYDIVVGSKQAGSQKRSTLRKFGSGLFVLCAQALLNLKYDDYSLGAKAYRIGKTACLANGISRDTNYVLDLICRGSRAGLPMTVLPVGCRDFRKSRFNLVTEAFVRFSHLFGLWLRQLMEK